MSFRFISFDIVNIFFSKYQHIYKCEIDLYSSLINKKLILGDLHFRHIIAFFCSISPMKIVPKKVPGLFCASAG